MGNAVNAVKKTWSDDKLALEVWKYYGGVGGRDKDTMIKIVTWLLGFSAAIIGFYAKGNPTTPLATFLLLLGISVSILAAFTALLYGGYAARNWAIADQIAKTYEWDEQCPSYDPIPRSKAHWTAGFSLWLARPCETGVAPVFWWFFFASLVSLSFHTVLLFHASCR